MVAVFLSRWRRCERLGETSERGFSTAEGGRSRRLLVGAAEVWVLEHGSRKSLGRVGAGGLWGVSVTKGYVSALRVADGRWTIGGRCLHLWPTTLAELFSARVCYAHVRGL